MPAIPPPDRDAILREATKTTLPLSTITFEPRISARSRFDDGHTATLFNALRAEANIGEIVVGWVEGCLSVIDGFHRVQAHARFGSEHVAALLMPGEFTFDEARWLAAALNWKAQLKLSKPERKEGFKAYIRAGGHIRLATKRGTPDRYKSYREIAQELGVPRSTVFRWITDGFPSLAAAMGTPEEDTVTKKTRGERLHEQRIGEIRGAAAQIVNRGQAAEALREVALVALYNAYLDLRDSNLAVYYRASGAGDIPWKTPWETSP